MAFDDFYTLASVHGHANFSLIRLFIVKFVHLCLPVMYCRRVRFVIASCTGLLIDCDTDWDC